MPLDETLFYIAIFLAYLVVVYIAIDLARRRTLKKLLKNYDEEKDTSRRTGSERTFERSSRSLTEAEPIAERLGEFERRSVLPSTSSNSIGKDSTRATRTRKGFFRKRNRK